MYSLKDKEGTIINNVREDYFADYDCRKLIGNIDFSVAIRQEGTYRMDEVEYMLWAEAKQGNKHPIYESFIQLILTIGKERTFDKNMPPKFLGAFDAEKIAFIPYSAVMEVFNQNDFNWNVTPSDHETKEFKQLEKMVRAELNKTSRDADNIYVFEFDIDDKELRRFIRGSMVSGRDHILRMRINHNNFKAIYEKWRRDVMPTINVDWDNAKRHGLIDADFYLADLIAGEDNITLLDKLHVLLRSTQYELDRQIGADGLFSSKQVQFRDQMLAHNIFWSKYTRPPKQEYWDRIIERRDLLVPQDIRERKGSYFTPPQWVELSQQYIANVLGENWQDEYYIWDCCAGTGNLLALAGLTNKYNIYASTLDKADVRVMQERIEEMGAGSNLLPSHVFQFDFLNDSFDDPKLPQSLRNILTDPDKRRRLVIYINPPYAEAGDIKQITGTGKNKNGVANATMVYNKYKAEIGKAAVELFAQFFIRVYHEIPSCTLAEFSTLKILQASNFADFRKIFQAKLERLFIVPAATFDNVKGQFPIGFFIWNTDKEETFHSVTMDVYDRNGEPLTPKRIVCNDDNRNIGKWIAEQKDKTNTGVVLGMMNSGRLDFQNQKFVYIANEVSDKSHALTLTLTNLIPAVVFLSIRHCIEATWLNDRDQFLYPDDGWKTDGAFQSDCLAYTLFHGQNRISHTDATPGTRTPSSAEDRNINHWIPFTEQELNSPDCFQSHFMSDFLAGKIRPEQPQPAQTLFDDNATATNGEAQERETNKAQPYIPNAHFSPAAQAVMEAGRRLWYYYLHYPESGNAPYGTEIDVNASFYDIRVFFQERNDKGKMNNDSDDAEYMRLLRDLRQKQKVLAKQIAEKVYRYGFLK